MENPGPGGIIGTGHASYTAQMLKAFSAVIPQLNGEQFAVNSKPISIPIQMDSRVIYGIRSTLLSGISRRLRGEMPFCKQP